MEMYKAQKRRFPLVFSSDFCKYNKRKRNEFEQNKTNNTKRVKRNGLWNERAPIYLPTHNRIEDIDFQFFARFKRKQKIYTCFSQIIFQPFQLKGHKCSRNKFDRFLMLFRQISLSSTPLFFHTFIFPSTNIKKPKLLF